MLATATIVAVLQIEKARDDVGNFITPSDDVAFDLGFVKHAIFGHLHADDVLGGSVFRCLGRSFQTEGLPSHGII